MALSPAEYRPRDAERGVLYRVVAEHLDAFLEAAANQADGARLPAFVEQEFRDFLTCGMLAHGFARLRCGDCAAERLVAFSCKGRGDSIRLTRVESTAAANVVPSPARCRSYQARAFKISVSA